jgi:FAD/FMN-containing dehydrogenase/ferredoxin
MFSSPSAPRTSFPSAQDPQGPAAVLGIADLHAFLHRGRPLAEREAPPRTRALALSLSARLCALEDEQETRAATLADRIVTDALVRGECDRDQNVYLGSLFTRFLTRAVPDLVFLPASAGEVAEALRWAREEDVPVTVRAAASTALGGAVPADGGLVLDLSRLRHIDIDAQGTVCVVGPGARMREIHARLAERGLALPVYSSNLGGTFAGWLVTGGVGLNAFGVGKAIDIVRAAELILPSGELIRLHADGRLDVPPEDPHRTHRELPPDQAEEWFRARELPPFGLRDLVGSEGVLGIVTQLVLSIGRRPAIGALLLGFATVEDAVGAAHWIADAAGRGGPRPANLKLVGAAHLRHARRVWRDEDARTWRHLPSALSAGEGMPWEGIVGPVDLGVSSSVVAAEGDDVFAAYLQVDFLDVAAARAFAARISDIPGAPRVLGAESVRVAAERFRPQQNKRLGPGLLAAEVRLPAAKVAGFLRDADRLAGNAGVALDHEVYFLADGSALAIAGYLTDQRSASFYEDLLVTPALVDLAVRRHSGRPYVLGRWLASFASRRFAAADLERLRRLKVGLDAGDVLNRGVLLNAGLRGLAGVLTKALYHPGVAAVSRLLSATPIGRAGRGVRVVLRRLPGPARRHGEPVAAAPLALAPTQRALHCVNCGECLAVCPIYQWSAIRLPQTLVHWGERLQAGHRPITSLSDLLDVCMRCGNCEEVCQAGIQHLDLYAAMDTQIDGSRVADQARNRRHVDMLTAIRGSQRYRGRFLHVRPGIYLRRSPAALSGTVRYLVLRAEQETGPAASCLHCAACVPVCPTGANVEYADQDARAILTDEAACVGCGVCVEVCPGNRSNGGQTLRVVEAPTTEWAAVMDEIGEAMGAEMSRGRGGQGR